MKTTSDKIALLREQGVEIPAPQSVEIGDEVDLSQVRGPKTVLHSGTKLYGERLMILPGARIGYEEPATVENCAVGRDVQLRGGYFSDAVFLDRVVMGKGSHVRSGTVMEEESNGAHTVGLKQTVLLPFVTLGSLINFCDVLMAGGTSRKDHSEVGSSYIHFNFTPFGANGDKATASLVGDVPRGVMLRSSRIFLGGQGGLVGPMYIDYGTVLAAGFVYRRDHGPDELVVGEKLPPRTMPFDPVRYGRIRDKVGKNLAYIGNLVALWHWYDRVRLHLAAGDAELTALYGRGRESLAGGIAERIKRLGQIAGYMEASAALLTDDKHRPEAEAQRAFAETWPRTEAALKAFEELSCAESADCAHLLEGLKPARDAASADAGVDYVEVIRNLDADTVAAGTRWLEQIVAEVAETGPF